MMDIDAKGSKTAMYHDKQRTILNGSQQAFTAEFAIYHDDAIFVPDGKIVAIQER